MRRPYRLTAVAGVRGIAVPHVAHRTYATRAAAERAAMRIVEVHPLVVVSVREHVEDEARFVCGVEHRDYVELREAAARAAREGSA